MQIGLPPDRCTEGLNSSLEQLALEGQSCVVGSPAGNKLKKGESLTGNVDDGSSHSDEGSSDEDSEEREPCTQEDILKDAGVEIVLEELSCTEDGKAPLELVTQVPTALLVTLVPTALLVARGVPCCCPCILCGQLHCVYVRKCVCFSFVPVLSSTGGLAKWFSDGYAQPLTVSA